MRKSSQRSREFWVYLILFASLGFLTIGVAYYHWYWPGEQGSLAIKRAKQAGVVALILPDVPDIGDTERIRAVFPGSDEYLLHCPGLALNGGETNSYSLIDTASWTIRYAPRSEWEAATGEIIDALPYRRDIRDYRFPQTVKTAGRHLRHREVAPNSEFVAIFSSDGRLHPPKRGLLFGGRNAYADGQRYIEVQSFDGLVTITPAVAIPSPCSDEPDIWWTADERFIVCRYRCYSNPRTPDSIVLVPTGLQKPYILKSGAEAKDAGYGVFQTNLWWEEGAGRRSSKSGMNPPSRPYCSSTCQSVA